MFRIEYWAGPKIAKEYLDAEYYQTEDGMFDLLDKDGNVVLSIRRNALISAVRVSAIVKEAHNGKIKDASAFGENVRFIGKIREQD